MSGQAFVTGGSGFLGQALLRRLAEDGWRTRALARSPRAAEAVTALGARAVTGDLADGAALAAGAAGCDVAFHLAALTAPWAPPEAYRAVNVEGTAAVLAACRAAGVGRLVHASTEAVLMAGEDLHEVDETAPLRPDSAVPYCATKAVAEQLVAEAGGPGAGGPGAGGSDLETVVVRPRMVWGPGDTTIVPNLRAAIEAGRFAWIGGGSQRTDATHVDNAVEGLVLAATRGRPGGTYFVTDGQRASFRSFATELLDAHGLTPPPRSLPLPVARAGAAACEAVWRALGLRRAPPLTRIAVWLAGLEATIDITRATTELGYRPVTGRAEGLAALARTS